uniref:Rho-GAP domain-containing protein n=1 Tax=Anopheles epiroticus TaxID=199890 RepID=A0A182P5F4_9DIPT
MSLPGHTQRLLVLLFGTFRVIASNSERADTGMTSEALGVSVAPSFFQSCVSDGKTARMKDVLRFKVSVRTGLCSHTFCECFIGIGVVGSFRERPFSIHLLKLYP